MCIRHLVVVLSAFWSFSFDFFIVSSSPSSSTTSFLAAVIVVYLYIRCSLAAFMITHTSFRFVSFVQISGHLVYARRWRWRRQRQRRMCAHSAQFNIFITMYLPVEHDWFSHFSWPKSWLIWNNLMLYARSCSLLFLFTVCYSRSRHFCVIPCFGSIFALGMNNECVHVKLPQIRTRKKCFSHWIVDRAEILLMLLPWDVDAVVAATAGHSYYFFVGTTYMP